MTERELHPVSLIFHTTYFSPWVARFDKKTFEVVSSGRCRLFLKPENIAGIWSLCITKIKFCYRLGLEKGIWHTVSKIDRNIVVGFSRYGTGKDTVLCQSSSHSKGVSLSTYCMLLNTHWCALCEFLYCAFCSVGTSSSFLFSQVI